MSTAVRELPTCTPLESGDRLNRAEFERRCSERPDIKKAELVEGVVYVASPVRIPEHAEPHGFMVFWLNAYRARHPEYRVADNGTVRLDDQNEPQPDVMMFRTGPGRIDSDGYLAGAPELAVEIAASSASYDLGPKMEAYRRNGVREYVVWQILEHRIDWFRLVDDSFVAVHPAGGNIESAEFPGLRLNVDAMLAGDLAAVQAALG
ncbi:MAG: Uma2 family endonuclease [Dehalococcoidia bacterium]